MFSAMRRAQRFKMSIPQSLTGQDILTKAKTGTGKTLAFLIPSLHQLHTTTTHAERSGVTSVLIISPTRELASQIQTEAKQLLSFLPKITQQCVYGGTNIKRDLSTFRKLNFPDVLVATPGRLNDHLENNGLAAAMRGLRMLIFDEADQLLEMGFRPEIKKMLSMLPSKDTRQTLLFSATMPKSILEISKFALRDNFKHVDCVGKEQSTHQRVPQLATVYPVESQFAELLGVLREGMQTEGFKIIVFFVTARLTQLHAELFVRMGLPVLEIHSRKSQGHRTRISKDFRENSNKILFTSDVSARGMDYPGVSMVVQVGLPSDKAQYIHRIGRTARAGRRLWRAAPRRV